MKNNLNKFLSVFFLSVILGLTVCSCSSKKADNSETQIAIQDDLAALEDEIEQEEPVVYTSWIHPDKQFEFRDQRVFYDIKKTTDYAEIGEDLDYKVFVNDEEKMVIIQYEETDCKQDWNYNYMCFPWPLKLDNKVIWTTYGYSKIYKSAQGIPLQQFMDLIEQHPDYKIVIWGWSLGSAMAKITARHFLIRTGGSVMIDELTTFGDVKCWWNPFYSVKKHVKRIREYANNNDLVTWFFLCYRRDVKCKVGPGFSLKRARKSEYNHTHYEEYDYTKWE